MSQTAPAPGQRRGEEVSGRADLAVRVLGGLVAVAGTLVTAAIEVFFAPLRAGSVRLPVSLVIAIVANLVLVWFTYRATGRRGAVVLPAVIWLAIMIGFASLRTREGDLLFTGDNWVAQLTLFGGSVAFGAGAYKLIVARPPAPPPAAAPPPDS